MEGMDEPNKVWLVKLDQRPSFTRISHVTVIKPASNYLHTAVLTVSSSNRIKRLNSKGKGVANSREGGRSHVTRQDKRSTSHLHNKNILDIHHKPFSMSTNSKIPLHIINVFAPFSSTIHSPRWRPLYRFTYPGSSTSTHGVSPPWVFSFSSNHLLLASQPATRPNSASLLSPSASPTSSQHTCQSRRINGCMPVFPFVCFSRVF